jgi:sulfoxide reductase heme-binding subunit YedZ
MAPATKLKIVTFILALLPLGYLLYLAFTDALGANPIEAIARYTGDWAMRFLLLTLTITPLRRWSKWNLLIRIRRMLGLFCYFYAVLHFASYVVLDQFFDWAAIWEDLLERPYITLGATALLMLTSLAITSTDGWVRRLKRNWSRLHKLVYPASILVMLHFFLMIKADYREPVVYALILGTLLLARWRGWGDQMAARRTTTVISRGRV